MAACSFGKTTIQININNQNSSQMLIICERYCMNQQECNVYERDSDMIGHQLLPTGCFAVRGAGTGWTIHEHIG